MTSQEKAAIRRRRPPQKDRCVQVIPVNIHYAMHGHATLDEKLHAIGRLLRSLANDCDNTADSIR